MVESTPVGSLVSALVLSNANSSAWWAVPNDSAAVAQASKEKEGIAMTRTYGILGTILLIVVIVVLLRFLGVL